MPSQLLLLSSALFTGFIYSCSKVNFFCISGSLGLKPQICPLFASWFLPLTCYSLNLILLILSDLTSNGGQEYLRSWLCVGPQPIALNPFVQSRALSFGMELSVNTGQLSDFFAECRQSQEWLVVHPKLQWSQKGASIPEKYFLACGNNLYDKQVCLMNLDIKKIEMS